MISGTALFLGLFNNLAIFIILVAVYGVLNDYFEKSTSLARPIGVGLVFGLFAIGCMYAKIPVAEGVIVDQRNTIVTLSGAFGGPLAALLCATLTGAYRSYLGGGGVVAGVIGVCLAAVAGTGLYKLRDRINSLLKASIGAMAATLIILPGFLLVGDIKTGWNLMMLMALPYGAAIFLGIFLVGVLLAHEEFRHSAEVEQKESEQRFRELFENLIDVSYRTDREGNFLLISPSSEKAFGYTPEEVIGKQIVNFYKKPSRRDEFMSQMLRDGHVRNFEAEIIKKDGSSVWVSTNAKLLRNKEGKLLGIEGVTRDISLIKKSEEERSKLEERLQQSQKMEAIGTLAGGIAHDFNNILAAIIGYAEMALVEIPKHSPANQDIKEVLNAGKRAKELVKHILSFSRKSEQDITPVQIHLIVLEALKLLRASIPSSIEIQQHIDTECGTIIANATEIHQVVMNLCTNAAQEMEKKGGKLSVCLERIHLSESDISEDLALTPGQYVKLSVKDTGPGIHQEVVGRIFDPYFTTKEVGKGSGLGLAVVHGIVDHHNGKITVETTPEKGTIFNVYFAKAEDVESSEAEENQPIPTGNENVLLIDDEPSVANVTKLRLKHLGYNVTSVNSSLEALGLFRSQPLAFDIVLTDQTMPEMTGDQLAKAILDVKPDALIILCTGYSAIIDAEKSRGLGIKGFIMKPIDQRELAVTVRNVLSSKNRK